MQFGIPAAATDAPFLLHKRFFSLQAFFSPSFLFLVTQLNKYCPAMRLMAKAAFFSELRQQSAPNIDTATEHRVARAKERTREREREEERKGEQSLS